MGRLGNMTGEESRNNRGPPRPTDDPNSILIYLLPFRSLSMLTFQQKWENIIRTSNGLIFYHPAIRQVGKRASVARSNKSLLFINDEHRESNSVRKLVYLLLRLTSC